MLAIAGTRADANFSNAKDAKATIAVLTHDLIFAFVMFIFLFFPICLKSSITIKSKKASDLFGAGYGSGYMVKSKGRKSQAPVRGSRVHKIIFKWA